MICAIILARNEENNIISCLNTLKFCREIIIIDDYSTDKTLNKVNAWKDKKYPTVRIYKRKLNGNFAAQRNFALTKAKSDWCLFVDADERVGKHLEIEILGQLGKSHKRQGYFISRRDNFMGKQLKFGETASVRLLRLGKKSAGRWQGRVHEVWLIEKKVNTLKNPIDHYPHPDISSFLNKINYYSSLVAQYWIEQGRSISIWEIIIYPAAKFLHNYFIKLGFLDQTPGLVMAVMMSFHSFLSRCKVYLNKSE